MPDKVLVVNDLAISFRQAVGTPPANQINFSPAALANGSGWASARYTFPTGPRPKLFRWQAITQLSPTVVGGTLDIYLATIDSVGTLELIDGGTWTPDAIISPTQISRLRNLQYVGAVEIDSTGTNINYISSGLAYIYAKAFQLIWHNNTGFALANNDNHKLDLIPQVDEIQ